MGLCAHDTSMAIRKKGFAFIVIAVKCCLAVRVLNLEVRESEGFYVE